MTCFWFSHTFWHCVTYRFNFKRSHIMQSLAYYCFLTTIRVSSLSMIMPQMRILLLTFFACSTFQCLLKHTVLKIIPLWHHKVALIPHGYHSHISDNNPSQVLPPPPEPAKQLPYFFPQLCEKSNKTLILVGSCKRRVYYVVFWRSTELLR